MKSSDSIRNNIQKLLNTITYAVLATENAGQPHTSLIAVTPVDAGQRLVFATYRNTRKFTNMMQNQRVSVLMDGSRRNNQDGMAPGLVLSAVGRVQEINATTHLDLLGAHLEKHPGLATFTHAPDCVLLEVVVEAYQVVHGIDDATWWCVDDLKMPL